MSYPSRFDFKTASWQVASQLGWTTLVIATVSHALCKQYVIYDAYCCCRKAREGEMDTSRRLNEMIANYGDVIPRRDYQQLQKQYEVRHTLQLCTVRRTAVECLSLSSFFHLIL